MIPEANSDVKWEQAGKNRLPAWCYYEFNPLWGERHGKLYNWYAMNDPRGLAPEGLKIPSKEDFEILLSSFNFNGNDLKAIGQGNEKGIGTNLSHTHSGFRFFFYIFI